MAANKSNQALLVVEYADTMFAKAFGWNDLKSDSLMIIYSLSPIFLIRALCLTLALVYAHTRMFASFCGVSNLTQK